MSEPNFFLLGDGLMSILIILAVILSIYITERSIFLHSNNIKPQQFTNGIISLLKNGHYNEAMTICEETHGFIPNIIKIALLFHKKDSSQTEYAVKNFISSIIPTLERRLNSIALIGKLSPVLGCIGSCIIFSHFITFVQTDASYVQSTYLFILISSILKITALGLFINVCANIGYSFLYGRVRRLINNMEWTYNEIMNFLSIGMQNDL